MNESAGDNVGMKCVGGCRSDGMKRGNKVRKKIGNRNKTKKETNIKNKETRKKQSGARGNRKTQSAHTLYMCLLTPSTQKYTNK